jgi:hypothetical protein
MWRSGQKSAPTARGHRGGWGDDRDRCLSLGGGNHKYIPAFLLRNDFRGALSPQVTEATLRRDRRHRRPGQALSLLLAHAHSAAAARGPGRKHIGSVACWLGGMDPSRLQLDADPTRFYFPALCPTFFHVAVNHRALARDNLGEGSSCTRETPFHPRPRT